MQVCGPIISMHMSQAWETATHYRRRQSNECYDVWQATFCTEWNIYSIYICNWMKPNISSITSGMYSFILWWLHRAFAIYLHAVVVVVFARSRCAQMHITFDTCGVTATKIAHTQIYISDPYFYPYVNVCVHVAQHSRLL